MYFFADPRPATAYNKKSRKKIKKKAGHASTSDLATAANRDDSTVGRVLRMFLKAGPVREILRELLEFRPLVPGSPQKARPVVDNTIRLTSNPKPDL